MITFDQDSADRLEDQKREAPRNGDTLIPQFKSYWPVAVENAFSGYDYDEMTRNGGSSRY